MPSSRVFRAALAGACALVFTLSASAATDDLYRDADAHAARGDASAAERAYDDILTKQPDDMKALIGRATARAWAGKHDGAQADYGNVLARDPNNLEALTGIGYSYAWNKQYADAEGAFKKALKVAPDNLGAQKGLGFTYLWSGRHAEALGVFEPAAALAPNDAEIKVAIGQAQAGMGERRRARASYSAALAIDPTRADARDLLRGLENGKHYAAELHVWAGSTSNGDAGLRSVEAAYWPAADWRLWARYDDSLSLDNPALARQGADAKTYFAGVLHQFGDEWIASFEAGTRELPAGADQQIYKAEGVHLDGTRTQKLGIQLSPHSDGYTDELVFVGYGFEIAERWRMEPTVFYSNTGAGNDNEWRGVLNLDYAAEDGWSIGLGAGGGTIDSDNAASEGGVFVAHARASVPIFEDHFVHALIRYEDAPLNEYTTAMVGLTLRLPAD